MAANHPVVKEGAITVSYTCLGLFATVEYARGCPNGQIDCEVDVGTCCVSRETIFKGNQTRLS